ncbi:MAG: DUF72 domain-containing protein [Deltaproteobacteria bacterium]|nr:DUF72 domain-containing protein [Deltaproteobacteria bacterium]
MKLFCGTSGYSYKAWKGSFYPATIKAEQMLAAYAEKLPAVEINNTFYRMPRVEVLDAWAAAVPESFRFTLKASRRITHDRRLSNVDELLGYLLRGAERLEDRLGALLFQLPPRFPLDLARLQRFLALLPSGVRCAFEFRDPAWHDEAVYRLLRQKNAALVIADDDFAMPQTARWGYLRFRRIDYRSEEICKIAEVLKERGGDPTFAFFKHDESDEGPRLAKLLSEVASVGNGVAGERT